MNNTIKQFAILVSNFIERTFIPLIQAKTSQNLKAIDQWNGLKAIMVDQQHIQIWKIENYLSEFQTPELKPQYHSQGFDFKDKLQSSTPNRNYSVYTEKQSWNMHRPEQMQIKQLESINKYNSPTLSSKLSPTLQKQAQKSSQSFQNLLNSFRKLCTNFENNHKKLMRDKETFAL